MNYYLAHQLLSGGLPSSRPKKDVPTCDIAMCGDHGIGECYGAVLDLPKCIAKGDDVCSLRYHKK